MQLEVQRGLDGDLRSHLEAARRVLALPVRDSRLHWHPFGVYTVPMAKAADAAGPWSRRLHVWHPEAHPVGEASPYGVHTHSQAARSHVLTGTLHHHLYAFAPDPGGSWRRRNPRGEGMERLVAHAWAPTVAGSTHTLPANHPHGVTKPAGLAVSLFEQRDGPQEDPFTTWQRLDVEPEPLAHAGPVPLEDVRREALAALETALFQAETGLRDPSLHPA